MTLKVCVFPSLQLTAEEERVRLVFPRLPFPSLPLKLKNPPWTSHQLSKLLLTSCLCVYFWVAPSLPINKISTFLLLLFPRLPVFSLRSKLCFFFFYQIHCLHKKPKKLYNSAALYQKLENEEEPEEEDEEVGQQPQTFVVCFRWKDFLWVFHRLTHSRCSCLRLWKTLIWTKGWFIRSCSDVKRSGHCDLTAVRLF